MNKLKQLLEKKAGYIITGKDVNKIDNEIENFKREEEKNTQNERKIEDDRLQELITFWNNESINVSNHTNDNNKSNLDKLKKVLDNLSSIEPSDVCHDLYLSFADDKKMEFVSSSYGSFYITIIYKSLASVELFVSGIKIIKYSSSGYNSGSGWRNGPIYPGKEKIISQIFTAIDAYIKKISSL